MAPEPAPGAPVERAVFCDFDGTLTDTETFVAMLRRFTPDLAAELIPEMLAERLELAVGVRRLLESIPSARYPDIVAFARAASLRAGLAELLDELEARGVPFVVVSGGLRGMVEAALGPTLARAAAVYAVDVDPAGPTLRVHAPLEGDGELVSKVRAMALHPAAERVVVGDSIPDLRMALAADVVFARDGLRDYLDRRGVAWEPWDDFHDVRRALVARWGPRADGRRGARTR